MCFRETFVDCELVLPHPHPRPYPYPRQTFTCDELEDVGQRYLRADYGIDCDSSKHKAFQLYAGVMILVRFIFFVPPFSILDATH